MLNSIKAHYLRLKDTDKAQWNQFRADLALIDMLTYFERSVISKPNKSLLEIPSGVRSAMIKHLGFTHENFDNNELPALSYESLKLAA